MGEQGRVAVFGSINNDLVASVARYPRLGETVVADDFTSSPGGKGANQAVAAVRTGAPTVLVGCLGDDSAGLQLRAFLQAEAIDTAGVGVAHETPTGTAFISLVRGGTNAIVAVRGANAQISADGLRTAALGPADVLVCQLEIPDGALLEGLALARAAGARTVVNAAPARELPVGVLEGADVLVVNETELAWFATGDAGAESSDPQVVAELARQVRRWDGQTVVATLGAAGVVVATPEDVEHVPAHPAEVVDTTGAGDCFIGSMAARMAAGDPPAAAVAYAVVAAALACERHGAAVAMPTAREVAAALGGQ